MNNFEHLSKGCQLCQQGKWLCIFLTYECNAGCHFCPVPISDDRVHSAFGDSKETVLSYLNNSDIEGISFSGGDPFLVFDRLIDWFGYFKNRLPELYYWVYTSGINADAQRLKQLSSAGMNEIRFNIAATGYLSAKILEKIRIARDLFPFVSVEIPSIHADFTLLAQALEVLDKTGIDYLNLHDYILSDSDPAAINEPYKIFVLNVINNLKYAESSLINTESVIEM